MKKFTKSLALAGVAATLLTFRAAAETAPTNAKPAAVRVSDLFTNSIIAKGKGVSVTRSQLDDALLGIKANAAASGRTIPPEQMTMVERQILQQLIQVQLLNSKATDADKASGKELTQKRLAEVRTKLGSDEMFQQQLKLTGMSLSELTAKMSEELTAEAVLRRELSINVSDDEVKKFYDENPAKFEEPEMVRAAHILIGTKDTTTGTDLTDAQKAEKKKLAESLLKRAKAGEDFGKLAKEYSDDPGSKDKGGEYKFPRGQMVPEFEAAAFSLNTNQVSDLVTTQFGYHIIKLYEKIPANKVAFDKVKDDIKDYLLKQALQKKVPDYIEKAEKDAGVQILDEKLKPVDTAPTMMDSGK